MAGTSPRRSVRARHNQSQNSSSASSISGRSERNTRSFNKTGSPQKSASDSLSSEPPDDPVTDNPPATRRRKRVLDADRDIPSVKPESFDMAIDDEMNEDDEVVRCVCGFEDYPGPPPFDHDSKQTGDGESEPISANDMTEDLAGFYLQCDNCNVWQHGACFGITDESSTPKEYFCELCRPSLHKIFSASNGQRYSSYLPVKRLHRHTSRASSHAAKDGTRSPQESTGKTTRLSVANHASKRRSTMNSRYDEEEQLRLAIEASKEDAAPDAPELLPSRRPKRGRSDSEGKPEVIKRQRTDSRSISPTVDKPQPANREESVDTMTTRNGASSRKLVKPPTTRNQRERSDREDRERHKAEAAKKRSLRADRRRVDDSPSDEIPLAMRAVTSNPVEPPLPPPPPPPPASAPVETPVSQPSPDTPPTSHPAPTVTNSHRKGTRAANKKLKGRNQHTRDEHGSEETPARSQSRDIQKNGDGGNNGHTPHHNSNNNNNNNKQTDHASRHAGGPNGKNAKTAISAKVSIGDMNRRANTIMDFITRTQLDLAGEGYGQRHSSRRAVEGGHALLAPNGGGNGGGTGSGNDVPMVNGSKVGGGTVEFGALSSMEMMDRLSGEIIQWQKEFCPELRG